MNLGAHDYVTKPFDIQELLMRVGSALERQQLLNENREYKQSLEQLVAERTSELMNRVKELNALNPLFQQYLSEEQETRQRYNALAKSLINLAEQSREAIAFEETQQAARDV